MGTYFNKFLEAGYELLLTFLMFTLAADFNKFGAKGSDKIVLFHDRTGGNGSYDAAMRRAFLRQMNDPTFTYKRHFTTIASRSWQNCLALQPADLMAFECYKEADARIAARKTRKSFQALLSFGAFDIHSKTFKRAYLEEFREILVHATKQKAEEPIEGW